MSSKLEKQLAEAASRRAPPAAGRSDVASTIFGSMGNEVAPPQLLPLDAIAPSRYQRRGKVDEAYMEVLVESVREDTLHDPVIVRPLPPGTEGGCDKITPRFELVAGHHRVEAFRRLGRPEIPAFVRNLSDIEAARALTSENTTRKNLGDWELYKHMQMLREAGAVKSNIDLARLLNIDRTIIQHLDTFGALPQSVHQLLDDHPGLVGYNLAKKLKPYCPQHELAVFDALCLLAKELLTQGGVPRWIEDQVNPRAKKPSKDIELGGGVRLVLTGDGARVSGNINYDALHRLVEDNLALLLKS
jgi:ParB family chromosome partitioning protein